MLRPGARHLNKIITHSSLSDQEYLINPKDTSGDRESWFEQNIERYAPIQARHFNRLNKKDCYLNKKDMNSYGHWEYENSGL